MRQGLLFRPGGAAELYKKVSGRARTLGCWAQLCRLLTAQGAWLQTPAGTGSQPLPSLGAVSAGSQAQPCGLLLSGQRHREAWLRAMGGCSPGSGLLTLPQPHVGQPSPRPAALWADVSFVATMSVWLGFATATGVDQGSQLPRAYLCPPCSGRMEPRRHRHQILGALVGPGVQPLSLDFRKVAPCLGKALNI